MDKVVFRGKSFEEYQEWASQDKKIFKKVSDLIKSAMRDPHAGVGKPEPLKHDLAGWWSRRITDEHRLVYRVVGDSIEILSCKYHYSDK